jgi:Transposase DDE domain
VPFKLNQDRRHHIPKQTHKVTNWPAYDAALRQRGSLTVWFSDEAIAAWRAESRTTRGGQACYSALAITTALTIRAVFRLALRQTEGLGVDADTGPIVAAALTSPEVDDATQVGPLLDQVDGPVASFTGDGAYDQESVYDAVVQRHPDAAVIIPPRSSAVPSETAETAPTQRDRHLQCIAEHGHMAWQKTSGYNRRARAEAAVSRYKRVIGAACAHARTIAGRAKWRLRSRS